MCVREERWGEESACVCGCKHMYICRENMWKRGDTSLKKTMCVYVVEMCVYVVKMCVYLLKYVSSKCVCIY